LRASVTRLEPRRGSFEQALVAFRAARFRASVSELHGIESVAASTLRARAFLRLGDPEAALRAVRQSAEANRDRGELALLRAVAASRLGDVELAAASFQHARVYGISSANTALEAEVEFYLALDAFGRGDLDEARTLCQLSLEVGELPPLYGQSGGVVPLAHVISRTQELCGLIEAADGRYRNQLTHAQAAIATLDGCRIRDVFQQTVAVRNLAILARDFDLEEDALAIAARADVLPWTDDVTRVKFITFEALGWSSAIRGDIVDALRRFRTAASAASTTPEDILVSVNRAIVAREAGHRALLVEEVERALNIADYYNWETAPDDYQLYLLPLAQVAAAIAPARARNLLTKHSTIRNAMPATFAARNELRVRAEEAYSHGIVLRVEGREAASIERLRFAFETWDAIGYEWRAACAALELAELRAGDVFRLAVARDLRRRPDSLFSARARQVA